VAGASRRNKPNHSLTRTLAAVLGTVPVALTFGLLSSQALPLSPSKRYLIGYFSVFPAWVALSLWVLLAPNGKRAWLGLFAASAVLGVALVVGRLAGWGRALPSVP
jgi:hypothetical protein